MPYNGTKRKVFISFHQKDQMEVEDFIDHWAEREGLFIPKVLGVSDNDDFIDSESPDYVMGQIRRRYLGDSTVTIVLVGTCTHSRRYVDWELKASLRQGENNVPNGVMGIILPSCGKEAPLPPRLKENWASGHQDCYARYWVTPGTADDLIGFIEDAYNARTQRPHFIQNGSTMMRYNRKCQVCRVTH